MNNPSIEDQQEIDNVNNDDKMKSSSSTTVTPSTSVSMNNNHQQNKVDPSTHRFPYSIVWTPIPCITWLLPFIGHMGIAYTNGVIRDFAGPYFVSEDDMGFGWPTKYWQLDLNKVYSGDKKATFDRAVYEASEIYKGRMHNLFCDNCHSHVARALNMMRYNDSCRWNMVKLCFFMLIYGKYVGCGGFLRTWLPFLVICLVVLIIVLVTAI